MAKIKTRVVRHLPVKADDGGAAANDFEELVLQGLRRFSSLRARLDVNKYETKTATRDDMNYNTVEFPFKKGGSVWSGALINLNRWCLNAAKGDAQEIIYEISWEGPGEAPKLIFMRAILD